MSACLIGICNTQTINFVNKDVFLTIYFEVTFSVKYFWLFTASLRTGSDDEEKNMATRIATLNIDFVASKNAALVEREILQQKALYIKNSKIGRWAN